MAAEQVSLTDGIKIGEETLHALTLRELTTADIMDAQEESERVVATPDGYQLVASPSLVGLNILRRQVLLDQNRPLELVELRRLSARDLAALQAAAETLDQATMREVGSRGRDGPGSHAA